MQDIFLSIIVPVYNVERYLRACLDSIARLTAVEWEAILIDDGSTDGSGAICNEYAAHEPRFRVIHQKNAGVSAARNAGLDVVRGEWIWFVDSDDTINADNLNSLFMQGLQTIIEPHDYVMFNLRRFNDNEEAEAQTGKCDNPILSDVLLVGASKNDLLLHHICHHHQRLFYKKSLVMMNPHQRLRFSEGLKVCEDGEFQYKYLMLCENPICVNTVIYNYRIRQGSATLNSGINGQVVKDTLTVLAHLAAFMKEHNVKMEPWLTYRLNNTCKILLVAAYRDKGLDRTNFQKQFRGVITCFETNGYRLRSKLPVCIAYASVSLYFKLLRLFFCIKRIK